MSAKLLRKRKRVFSARTKGSIHRIAAENLGHVLVQPFHLILSSIAKLLDLHVHELGGLVALSLDPLRRADRGRLETRRHCCMFDALLLCFDRS